MSEQETQPQEAEFAFLVIKQKDGRLAVANVNNTETARQPTMEDISTALTMLSKDIERQATAMAVLQGLNQMQTSQKSSSGLVVPEKRFVKRGK